MRGRPVRTTSDQAMSRQRGIGALRGAIVPWLLGIGLLCGACTGESGSPQQEGARPVPIAGSGALAGRTEDRAAIVSSARLQPDPLTRSEPISVYVEAADPDGSAVRLTYQWFLNGEPLEGQTNPSLSPELVEIGDRVSVEITPVDLKGAGLPHRTEETLVVNTPPKVTKILVQPFPVRVGGHIEAVAESEDPDGDDVTYEFRWFHNGEEVLRADNHRLNTAALVRGDELVVEVTPSDGTDAGEPQRSEPVLVDNSPPEITSTPPSEISGGLYSYAVKATDPDGDELSYSLETGPPGMSIDAASGLLRWTIGPDSAGSHQVRIAVSDRHVTEPTVQEFNVTLGEAAGAS